MNIVHITSKQMKVAITIIVGVVIMTTIMFAQNHVEENENTTDTIAYIKRETIGGKLDFTYVLKKPDHVPIDHKGVRFNKNDYYVFLWGEAVADLGLKSSAQAGNLWEEIHDNKLTGPQRTALRIGFEKAIK